MSRKRRLSEGQQDSHEVKQRQRMTTYQQTAIFQTTQQKLYDGSKTFFRKLKDSAMNHDTHALPLASCCSSMHCTTPIVANCDYCERHYCTNHLVQCSQCVKTFCPFCSTNVNNEYAICLTCLRNEY